MARLSSSSSAVRRALDADPRTGQRRWTSQAFLYQGYRHAELGYAVTDHAAQGRTVHTGLAVITGTEDRQHAYVALTRGTDANLAYVFTVSPGRADPVPAPRSAPELARYDKTDAERSGVPAPPAPPAPLGTALGVLSAVLDHDGQQISATQTRHQTLAEADHLTVPHATWTAETTPGRLPNALVSDGQWLESCQSIISSRRLSKAALKSSRWKHLVLPIKKSNRIHKSF
jgi:hypothetical protein